MTTKTGKGGVTIYYENWLLRKEGVKQWAEYWGVIRGKWLQFYERTSEYNRPELRKTLEITTNTKCALVKRNKNRYPFSIDNGSGVYYMKVETELERYHWIVSILTASLGKPKRELPEQVPETMKEAETFRKLTKVEKQEMRNKLPPKPKKEPIPASDITNKRRRKFAERRENKVKKKERARLRKLGLDPDEHMEGGSNDDEELEEISRHPEHFRRAQNVNKLTSENLALHNRNKLSVDDRIRQREKILGSSPNFLKPKTSELESSQSTVEIKAMIHPPSASTANKKQERNSDSSHYNRAFENDDIEELPTIPVTLNDDGLLPNMVFTELSDSEPEEPTTEEISINSNNESLLNIGDFDMTQPRRGSATILSRTVLSESGVRQYSESPDPIKMMNRGGKRPTSAKLSPGGLMERPISPLMTRPMSPLIGGSGRPKSPNNLKNSDDFARYLDETSTV
ncbi:uncharacterized protein [Clytia hemisphaerica]|uniref:PH domain-containing protein n=1 Tax=Clytia hemisphaerica TaxID=252671 RepID=A0A7M5WMF3_9CNID